MSRESDSSSTGPQGHGGDEYVPPGAAPARAGGTPAAGERARGGAEGDERPTETTLTTRISINIPGSRPIPPVVMRTPVSQADGDAATDGSGADGAGGATAGRDDTPGTTASGDPGATRGKDASGSGSGDDDTPKVSDWFAPRKPPRGTSTTSGSATGGSVGPGSGGGGGGAHPGAGGSGPRGAGARGSGGGPGIGGPGLTVGGSGGPGLGDVGGGSPAAQVPSQRSAPPHPPGSTSTPPFGTGPGNARSAGSEERDESRSEPAQGGTGASRLGAAQKLPPGFSLPDGAPAPTAQQAPAAQQGAPTAQGDAPGALGGGPLGGGPETRGPAPAEPRPEDTLAGGIPPVPPSDGDRPVPPPPGPPVPRQDGEDQAPAESSAPAGPASKKRGRSKLALLGGALFAVVCVAYGAGLMLGNAEVPKGTSVLGVDIGGVTKQEAVKKLEAGLGDRDTAPLRLSVGGESQRLKPSVAGLSIDTEATVREAAGRDWNPVTVIGTLLGGTREVEAAIVVDEEKLRFALEELAGSSKNAREGTVEFRDGKAVPVQGKPYRALDVGKSVRAVTRAYRERAATGDDAAVTLPVTTRQPKVDAKEVRRALKEFGEPAMSGWLYLRAGGVEVPFSQRTLGELLSMKPSDNGRLQPVMDLRKLAEAYGGAFEGVMIDGGAGKVPMQPKHAAAAMLEALREPAPPAPRKRVAEVSSAVPPGA